VGGGSNHLFGRIGKPSRTMGGTLPGRCAGVHNGGTSNQRKRVIHASKMRHMHGPQKQKGGGKTPRASNRVSPHYGHRLQGLSLGGTAGGVARYRRAGGPEEGTSADWSGVRIAGIGESSPLEGSAFRSLRRTSRRRVSARIRVRGPRRAPRGKNLFGEEELNGVCYGLHIG